MSNNPGWYRSGVWNPKCAVMSETPNVIGCRLEVSAEAITPSQVLINRMYGFVPSIELCQTAFRSHIARLSESPDRTGLAV